MPILHIPTQVLMAVNVKITVVWSVIPCSLVDHFLSLIYLILYIFYVVTFTPCHFILFCFGLSYLVLPLYLPHYFPLDIVPSYFYFFIIWRINVFCFIFVHFLSAPIHLTHLLIFPQYFCLRYTVTSQVSLSYWSSYSHSPGPPSLRLHFCPEDRESTFPRSQATRHRIPEDSNLHIIYC
jgi:hypothetical protein